MKKFMILFFFLFYLIGCVSMREDVIQEKEIVFFEYVEISSIKVELIIDTFSLNNNIFKITLKVTNLIDKDLALENVFLRWFEHGVTNSSIKVENEKGEEIAYIGPMFSMLVDDPPRLEKCTILKAGETIFIKSSNLYDNYDFEGLYSDVTFKELNFYYSGYLGESQVVTITDLD